MNNGLEKKILLAIRSNMVRHGWRLQKIAELPDIWARDTEVTPFFYCTHVPRRPYGSYVLEGAVGVVHRGFEALWSDRTKRLEGDRMFALSTLTGNLPGFLELMFVELGDELEKNVGIYCEAVSKTLERMPTNETGLITVFKTNELINKPLYTFLGLPPNTKLDALREYVECLPSNARK